MSSNTVGPPVSLLAVPSLDNTFGVILIGTFIGLIMYGLSLYQTFRYFRVYVGDPLILRYTIIFLAVLDTMHSVACMYTSYYYVVTNYFNPVALLSGVWSIRVLAPLTGGTVLVAQSFYLRRMYLLGSWYAYAVIPAGVLVLGTAGFAVATSIEIFTQRTFLNFEHYTWLMSGGFACSLATDVVLAASFIIFLTRSRTGFRRTNSALSVILVYTVNTGLLTSALSLLSLVFGVIQPGNFIFIAANMIATKSYVNAVLAVANSRRTFTESSRDLDGFGTFGLSVHPQPSQGSPIRMEHFNASTSSNAEGIDLHLKALPTDSRRNNLGVDSAII
ncbi:hypothetical protein BD311DRAFT_700759 [Dichomitus squalens]|uniref:DUF6534 domain-containing protein n=1 Tax=Dichomitus squalens TaxID=114155 RepID=A0A4V2JZI8_9APHY|nr:hypothetical protein BD311DRAFT_700759 [Dichomitus squalens]